MRDSREIALFPVVIAATIGLMVGPAILAPKPHFGSAMISTAYAAPVDRGLQGGGIDSRPSRGGGVDRYNPGAWERFWNGVADFFNGRSSPRDLQCPCPSSASDAAYRDAQREAKKQSGNRSGVNGQ